VLYTQQPRLRSAQKVLESLFGLSAGLAAPKGAPTLTRSRPEYKRVWASLLKGKGGIIGEMAQEMYRRDPGRTKQWVVLTDGERAWQQTVGRHLRGVPLVLDPREIPEYTAMRISKQHGIPCHLKVVGHFGLCVCSS
jgi:hypothetical protein